MLGFKKSGKHGAGKKICKTSIAQYPPAASGTAMFAPSFEQGICITTSQAKESKGRAAVNRRWPKVLRSLAYSKRLNEENYTERFLKKELWILSKYLYQSQL
ncbi:MAG: hypothetical protein IT211_04275 [Armatimonadetes bacterium]|nr:hypothetical protein [Armatimonadota bacterium]